MDKENAPRNLPGVGPSQLLQEPVKQVDRQELSGQKVQQQIIPRQVNERVDHHVDDLFQRQVNHLIHQQVTKLVDQQMMQTLRVSLSRLCEQVRQQVVGEVAATLLQHMRQGQGGPLTNGVTSLHDAGLTLAQAARTLQTGLPYLKLYGAKSRVRRAIANRQLLTNAARGTALRIDTQSYNQWHIRQVANANAPQTDTADTSMDGESALAQPLAPSAASAPSNSHQSNGSTRSPHNWCVRLVGPIGDRIHLAEVVQSALGLTIAEKLGVLRALQSESKIIACGSHGPMSKLARQLADKCSVLAEVIQRGKTVSSFRHHE